MPNQHPCTHIPLTEYLEARSIPEPNSGCLLWTGGVDRYGYGIGTREGKNDKAHRLAWRSVNGNPPLGGIICHKCDVRSCVNPDHLFVGTHSDNAKDRNRKGRQSRGEAHAMSFAASAAWISATPRGERHASAILTEDAIRRIRSDQRLQKVVAAEHGICQSHVSLIKRRKLWAHVI